MPRRNHIRLWLISGGFLLLGGILFSVTGRDDLFKTLFAAQSLAETGHFLNYNGEAVEQSSSLAMVIFLSGLKALFGGEMTFWSLWVSLLAFFGIPFQALRLARALELSPERQQSLPWLLASMPFALYWAWSGMEATLAAFLLLAVLAGLVRWWRNGNGWGFWIFLPFFLMVRPENGLLLGIALAGTLVWLPGNRRKGWWALGTVVLGALALLAWREWVFGRPFPLPVMAKSAGLDLFRAYKGLGYLYRTVWAHPYFALLGLLALGGGIWWLGKRGKAVPGRILVAVTALTGLAFVIFSGGDWMENGRFWVPILPLMVLLIPDLRAGGSWWIPLLIAVQTMGIVWTARHHSSGRPIWEVPAGPREYSFAERANRFHYRDIATIEALLPVVDSLWERQQRPVRVLSQQAGMVIHHLATRRPGQVHFTDLVGLSTDDFHQCERTRNRGKGWGGLNMDLYYLVNDLEQLKSSCGFEPPDLIFDLDDDGLERQTFLARNGYRIVYRQSGYLDNGNWFPGLEVSNHQFIAVRLP